MTGWLATLLFLVGYYWPYMLGAAAIGAVTGWLSLPRRAPE